MKKKQDFMNLIYIQNIIIIIFIFFTLYQFYKKPTNKNINKEQIIIKNNFSQEDGLFPKAKYSYSNVYNDVLLNPYTPPLKNTPYIIENNNYNKIPINIKTNIGYMDNSYKQVGILKHKGPNLKILPLMGKPLYSNRNKWNYYTIDDKNNIKLQLIFKKKNCTSENGCDEIYNRDKIFVKGYDKHFETEIYENDTLQYIPFI